jgi:hypothetical protein
MQYFSCHETSQWVSLPIIRLSGKRISWRKEMQLVKLGKKGQGSLPKAILQQADIYPIEIYSDERIASFLEEDRMTPDQTAMLNKALKK